MCFSLPLYFIPHAPSSAQSNQGTSKNTSQETITQNSSVLQQLGTFDSSISNIINQYSGMIPFHLCDSTDNDSMGYSKREDLCLLQKLIADGATLSQQETDLLCTHLTPVNLTMLDYHCFITTSHREETSNCDSISKGSQKPANANISHLNSFVMIRCQNQTNSTQNMTWCLEGPCQQDLSIYINQTTGNQMSGNQKFSTTFWIYFWVYFVGVWTKHPIFAMINAVVYSIHGEERWNQWGKQRLWGE